MTSLPKLRIPKLDPAAAHLSYWSINWHIESVNVVIQQMFESSGLNNEVASWDHYEVRTGAETHSVALIFWFRRDDQQVKVGMSYLPTTPAEVVDPRLKNPKLRTTMMQALDGLTVSSTAFCYASFDLANATVFRAPIPVPVKLVDATLDAEFWVTGIEGVRRIGDDDRYWFELTSGLQSRLGGNVNFFAEASMTLASVRRQFKRSSDFVHELVSPVGQES
jgi:hypothetical protein